jgi:hypothetical protein
MAAALAVFSALVSLALGFLAEDFGGAVPARWLAVFVAASVGAFALLLVAVLTGRRSAADRRFLWETALSVAAAGVFGCVTALKVGFPGYMCLAGILATYVTLARWTWWTWRAR